MTTLEIRKHKNRMKWGELYMNAIERAKLHERQCRLYQSNFDMQNDPVLSNHYRRGAEHMVKVQAYCLKRYCNTIALAYCEATPLNCHYLERI